MTLLTMVRGDRAVFDLALTDDAGDALDLDGLALTFTARRRIAAGVALEIVKTDSDGIAVNEDPTTGLATLTIEPADTEDWTDSQVIGPFDWDVELRTLDGDVRTPLRGVLRIDRDVTAAPVS